MAICLDFSEQEVMKVIRMELSRLALGAMRSVCSDREALSLEKGGEFALMASSLSWDCMREYGLERLS